MNWLDIALGFLLGFGCGVAVVFKKWVDSELRRWDAADGSNSNVTHWQPLPAAPEEKK